MGVLPFHRYKCYRRFFGLRDLEGSGKWRSSFPPSTMSPACPCRKTQQSAASECPLRQQPSSLSQVPLSPPFSCGHILPPHPPPFSDEGGWGCCSRSAQQCVGEGEGEGSAHRSSQRPPRVCEGGFEPTNCAGTPGSGVTFVFNCSKYCTPSLRRPNSHSLGSDP